MVGDERIDSVCTLWGAGVQASPLGKLLGAEVDKKGCVLVDSFLNPHLPGSTQAMKNVFIVGDLAHFDQDGKQVPGVAQPAMQMGDFAARRIGQLVAGKPLPKGFRYFDKGDMATIGRAAAVANIKWPFKGQWSGFPAWLAWLMVHIFFLIGFRNRFAVFRQWAWTYLTFDEGARLITGSQVLPGWDKQERPHGETTTTPVSETLATAKLEKPMDLGSPKTA
jgi:NADH dehydrogenase